MKKMIRMKQVSISFQHKKALENLECNVYEGEIFGFLGPSGAGKTTTIKLLTKQLLPDEGEIYLNGENLRQATSKLYDHVGVQTDNSGIYERLSVYENLKLFADLYRIDPARIDEVLEQTGLAEDKKKKAKVLSKGMKQRLILARAVLHKPQLLFLDEPTAALDPATSKVIHNLLTELNAEGVTIFLTTHNMEEADKLCDRVAFLNQGTIREIGRPAELKMKYSTDKIVCETTTGETYIADKTAAGLYQLAVQLERHNIATIHSAEPSLEEIFLSVTGRELV